MAKQKAQILAWGEVRDEVRQVNIEFADIIDSLNLKEELIFLKVDYPYGAPIFDKGKLFVPNEYSNFVPIDSVVSSQYNKFFDCNLSPLGLVLKKGLGLSIEEKEQFVPLCTFYPGQFFGLWELFDCEHSLFNKSQWNLYSGARSLFSTTKISNFKKFQHLKRKFNLKSRLPKHLKDHYYLFRELANHDSFSSEWCSSVIFFGKDVQEKLIRKDELLLLQTYFLKYIWRQSMPWRFDAMMRLVWNQVSDLLKQNHFKNFGFQLSILKHITKVLVGALPCFTSNDSEELTAPLGLIKEVLIDEYKVDFCPTIMVPGHFGDCRNRCGYYSVNESVSIEEAYIDRSKKTSIETMRGICEVYEFIKNSVFNNDAYIDNQMIKLLTKEVELDFFHSIFDQKELLLMSSLLPEEDPSLTRLPKKYGKSVLPFNENGSFFRGLIRFCFSC